MSSAESPCLRQIIKYYSGKSPSIQSVGFVSPTDLELSNRKGKVKLTEFRSLLLGIGSSIVSVSIFRGVDRKIDCSGLIIGWDPSQLEATILTSAKLIRLPEDDERDKYSVVVRLATGEVFSATEDYVDFYLNILTLKIRSNKKLETVDLESRVDGESISDGMDIISLGRSFHCCSILFKPGKLFVHYPYYGCEELFTSTCHTSEMSEGGPVITTDGRIVGINFFDNDHCAHPLPFQVIRDYMEIWRSYGAVSRLWFGMAVVDLNQLPLSAFEKLYAPNRPHLVVNEVYEESPASDMGVRPGDFVVLVGGPGESIECPSQEDYNCYQLSAAQDVSQSSANATKYLMVVKRYHDRADPELISVPAACLSVDDRRFSCCWPLDESPWSGIRPGSPPYERVAVS